MSRFNIKHLFLGALALILGGCGGEDSGAPAQAVSIVSLQVTPAVASVPAGFEQKFIATAILSDGSSRDVTNDRSLSWSSSDEAIATVVSGQGSGNGVATTSQPGVVTITASGTSDGTPFSGEAKLTVSDAVVTGMQVTPAKVRVPAGLTQQYQAIAIFSDGSTLDVTDDPSVKWSSSDPLTAKVSNGLQSGNGVVTTIKPGGVTITASDDANGTSFSATAELTVTDAVVVGLQVTPSTARTPVGLTRLFVATALLSDGTTRNVSEESLNWTSSDPTIADMVQGQKALVKGLKVGVVSIEAEGNVNGKLFSGTAELTVTDAIATDLYLTPTTTSTPIGRTQQFVATAVFSDDSTRVVTDDPALSWGSNDPSVASVSSGLASGNGLATGVSQGQTTIKANLSGSLLQASAELTVTDAVVESLDVAPTTSSVPVGLTQQFTAQASFSDGSVRDVTNDPALSWISSNPTTATVISSQESGNGEATAVRVGETTITASLGGVTDSAAMTVTSAIVMEVLVEPATASVAKGRVQQFTAQAKYSDGSTPYVTDDPALSWTSSALNIATVSSNLPSGNGLATTVNPGTATISAMLDGVKGSADLTVTPAVVDALVVSPALASVALNKTLQFTAQATLSDGTTPDVTNDPELSWISSDAAIATISTALSGGNGLATGVTVGEVTITANIEGKSAEATLMVTKPGWAVVCWGSAAKGGDCASAQSHQNIATLFPNLHAFAALKQDGSVVVWGDQSYGGKGSDVQGLTDVRTIVASAQAGGAFAALKYDGSVFTWGSPSQGGDSSSVKGKLVDVRSIHASTNSFAALKGDGTVVTWGNSSTGGDSAAVANQLHDVQSIVTHPKGQAFAALRGDGKVVTWGNPSTGGNSGLVQSLLIDVKAIFYNSKAFAALKNDGTVVTWGDTNNGSHNGVVPGLSDVKTIYSNTFSFAALKTDNTVFTWGSSGNGGTNNTGVALDNVKRVYATDSAYAALKNDDTVVTWGNASFGGNSTNVSGSLVNIDRIFGASAAFTALTPDGSSVSWGNEAQGGSGTPLTGVSTIANNASGKAFVALMQDGSVQTWGEAASGGDSQAVQDKLVNARFADCTPSACAALVEPVY